MAKFLKVATLDVYEDHWWTEGETWYESDLTDELIVVPDHFKTDLASIPKFPPGLRTILIRNGHHRMAALVHDYL